MPTPPEVRQHGSVAVDRDRDRGFFHRGVVSLMRYTLSFVLFQILKSNPLPQSHLHSQKAALEISAGIKKQQRALLHRHRNEVHCQPT